ncbi:BLUF domain-containing protein [uncultured Sneathiella sp.]|uniref:BLUF domain-containing protein n=1 Tax=uncultured Sneathiella sp. TaxID=879315 RepID=UPI002599F717|nr:BLUF domain-containing protein [uncultured Sneathiella sp.]
MHYLVYVSTARHLMNEAELMAILEKSRSRNTADNITGMLLYKEGSFMQVLEGRVEAIEKTYARIGKDPRHDGLILLRKGKTEKRNFPGWSMGYRAVNADDLAKIPGFVHIKNGRFTDQAIIDNPHIAMTALKAFNA